MGHKILAGTVPACVYRVARRFASCRADRGLINKYYDGTASAKCDDDLANYFNKLGSKWVNSSCKAVSAPPRSCGNFTIRYTDSPLSLVWDETAPRTAPLSSAFPLSPAEAGQWHIWRASAALPLLVYDPSHKGQIASAAQLFGSWTFGGKRSAALSSSGAGAPAPWANGYEALATLDVNGDKEISGAELASLALWFDRNQNGVAESGEVVSLAEAGVAALYFTPDSIDPVTGDVRASLGYKRLVGHEVRVGASVDWFSPSYSSEQEATAALNAQAQFGKLSAARALRDHASKEPPAQSSTATGLHPAIPLNGAWLWHFDEKDSSGEPKGYGILTFAAKEGESISGHSYVELELSAPIGDAERLLIISSLQGRQSADNAAETLYSFQVINENSGVTTETKARYLKEEDELVGESVMHTPLGDQDTTDALFSYAWRATRISK